MEEQDEKMTVSFIDPLKVEVKVEANYDNPWSVDHASAFLKYCCPECEYRNETLDSFANHALQNHENAIAFFSELEKNENIVGVYGSLDYGPYYDESNEDYEKSGLMQVLSIKEENRVKDSTDFDKELNLLEGLPSQNVSDIEKPKVKRSKTITLAEKLEIIQLYENGTKISKIAKDKEMPRRSVRDICKMKDKYKSLSEQGASGNVIRFGSQSKKHLPLAEKLEIIQLYENGTKTLQIGKAKGMPESSVRLICKNKDKYKAQSEQVVMKEPNKLKCYKCSTCGLKTQGRKQYDIHKQSCLQICELCDMEFADSQLFKSHIADNHMTGEQYICAYCDLKFKGWTAMKYHTDVKHIESGENKFFCTKCPKGFSYQSSLKRHDSSHLKWAKKHICEICATEYQTLNGFREHMAKNHSTGQEAVLICDKCDFTAPLKSILFSHIRQKHDIDKHKQCPCCNFKTPQKQKLCIHIDVHHPEYDEKKLFCDKCGKSFIYELSLKQHVNFRCKFSEYEQNERKKVFNCDHCHMTFTKKHNLQSHVIKVHEKSCEFACDHCGKKWATSNLLRCHIKKTHIEHVNCEICNKKISNPFELKRHKVFVHKETKGAWLCVECPKSAFFSKSSFERHMKTKH